MDKRVRIARKEDVERIMDIVAQARQIMRDNGNMLQWTNGYPQQETILQDIENENAYVVEEDQKVVAYFAFIFGEEPTYKNIYEGEWIDDTQKYYTIHRIASTPESKGVIECMLEYCFSKTKNIRIDTHRDNSIMHHLMKKNGFAYCGIIYLENGDERLAYQKLLK